MGQPITERFVKNLANEFHANPGAVVSATSGNRIWYDDGKDAVGGFGLRITSAGIKSFVINYRHRGRERRMTIGRWPAWSALQARERARELRRMVDNGSDPLETKEQQRSAPLMSALFERYFTDHAEIHKKPRSVADDRYLIHGSPRADRGLVFGGLVGKHFNVMQVDSVTNDAVREFHLGLKHIPTRANRSLSLLSKVFNLAEEWGYRPQHSNPCRHVKKYAEHARQRYLRPEELTRLGKALDDDCSNPAGPAAIRLLLFTGMRVGELLSLRWQDVDLKSGVARLNDAKAGGRDVQLPTPALTVLAKLKPGPPASSVLALPYGALHSLWVRTRRTAKIDDVRIHDLRHTTGTYAGSAGFNAFLVKQLLGHKTLSMTDRYVQLHIDPLRAVSKKVAEQIDAAMRGKRAEVVILADRDKSR